MKAHEALAVAMAVLAIGLSVAQAHPSEDYVVCNLNPKGDNFLALRACGSTDCHILTKLAPNTSLLMHDPLAKGRWFEVTVRSGLQHQNMGPTGWVYGKYICEIGH